MSFGSATKKKTYELRCIIKKLVYLARTYFEATNNIKSVSKVSFTRKRRGKRSEIILRKTKLEINQSSSSIFGPGR